MGWNDTLATYMLAIPEDSIDLVDMNDLLYCVNNVTAFYTLNHDKSAENIFSNSIDIWKNIGNFEFVENIGQCFADINSIETIYENFINTSNPIRERIIKNPDAYQGNSLVSKALHDKEYRNHLIQIHSQEDYFHYLAAYLRWKNAKNMKLMNVTEEELKHFIEEKGRKEITQQPAPDQDLFRTPPINPDNLPDLEDWLKK
jgi:capsid portal protein